MDNLFMCLSVCLHATPSPRDLITFLSIRVQLEMLLDNRDQSVNLALPLERDSRPLVSLNRLSVKCGTTPRRQSGYLLLVGVCLFIRVIWVGGWVGG